MLSQQRLKKSSSARAEEGQGERRVVAQSTKSDPGLPGSPHSPIPTAPDRIQMMTGTAAATFPISSSVCMIFLIRAWGGGQTAPDPVASVPERVLKPGREREHPGRRGQGAPTLEGHGRGRGVRGPGGDAPASLVRPGPGFPSPARSSGAAHVLTGGNRALYFFLLAPASPGPLPPRRTQRRRPQPPGTGPALSPSAAVPPGPGARRLRPNASYGVLAPPVRTPPAGPAPSPLEPPGLCASVRGGTATPRPPPKT